VDKKEFKDDAGVPSLQLKIYERIPIPDLAVNTSNTAKSVDIFFNLMLFSFHLCFFFFACALQVFTINFHIVVEFVGYISSQEAIFPYHRHGMVRMNMLNTSLLCD
jgi:hypothetical protein